VSTSFTLFEILLIIGISQGLVTSALLLTSKEKLQSKRILGITVFIFCITNCKVILHTSGLWNISAFRYFPVGMELLLPPLVYLYILSLTKADFKIEIKYVWHFIPGLFYAFYDMTLYFLALSYDSMAAKHKIAELLFFDLSNLIEDYLIVSLTIIYVVLGYKRISVYLTWLKQFKQYKTFPIYGWLKSLIFWSCILGAVLMTNQLMFSFSIAMDYNNYRWKFFNILIAFVTYYLGFMGYKKDGLNVHVSNENLTSLAKKLNKSQQQDIESLLIDKLEKEVVYLDASITLKKLAVDLGITSESLSLVVNQTFEMGFRDLMNTYRINHVKKLLRENTRTDLSILDIALDSGFNSQASFYRAFNKFEGMSPKNYLANLS
jgi:AraC-like DNA-binding protein